MYLLRWEFMDEDDTFKIHLEQHTTVTDYAILSHRWGKPEVEVSFDDMIAGTHESKKGHEKLVGCSSSAELSDPITSMFAYYNQSRVCYAFLNDVIIEPGSLNQSPPAFVSRKASGSFEGGLFKSL
ncbi:hypothetical protein RAB80_010084 [Fusarium oxysporum f. sp. vasinfectum]|nr:hypothetical protein RAB80_010084 [Fusarium oxysporum f. sp. vasinfectum]